MVIEKVKEFNGVYDAWFLSSNYAICNFFQVGNKYVAIITNDGSKITNCSTIVVKEVVNKPLWKQQMELSMGRMLRPDIRHHNFRVRELTDLEIQRNRFEVYRETY